jgi:hypothetical protein
MDVGVVVVVPQAKATSTRTASGINIFLIIFPPLQKYKKIWIYFASIHEVGRFANLQALNRILNHQIKCLLKGGIAFLVNLLQTILCWPFRLDGGGCPPGRKHHLSCAGESDDKNPMRDQEPILTKPGTQIELLTTGLYGHLP